MPEKPEGTAAGPTPERRERHLRPVGAQGAPDGAARAAGRRGQVTTTLDNLDEPFLNDLDEAEAPPIPGKVHPSAELSDAIPTLDDEVRHFRHHPNETGSIEFEVNPYLGDAAADLAGDLGSEFLEGATRGQDISDIHMLHDDQEADTAFLYEDAIIEGDDVEEDEDLIAMSPDDEIESERRPLDREMQDGPRAGQTHLRSLAGKRST